MEHTAQTKSSQLSKGKKWSDNLINGILRKIESGCCISKQQKSGKRRNSGGSASKSTSSVSSSPSHSAVSSAMPISVAAAGRGRGRSFVAAREGWSLGLNANASKRPQLILTPRQVGRFLVEPDTEDDKENLELGFLGLSLTDSDD